MQPWMHACFHLGYYSDVLYWVCSPLPTYIWLEGPFCSNSGTPISAIHFVNTTWSIILIHEDWNWLIFHRWLMASLYDLYYRSNTQAFTEDRCPATHFIMTSSLLEVALARDSHSYSLLVIDKLINEITVWPKIFLLAVGICHTRRISGWTGCWQWFQPNRNGCLENGTTLGRYLATKNCNKVLAYFNHSRSLMP